ncbi:MAG: FG-GAP repeat domain-containing protein [Phycisphaeraceae bacterium]
MHRIAVTLTLALLAVTTARLHADETAELGAPLTELHVIDPLPDADGAQLADIDGDGRLDIAAAASKRGEVVWYRQGEDMRTWTRHAISTGHRKLEGIDAADFNGDGRVDVIALDQVAGTVILFTPRGDDPTGEWESVVLAKGRHGVQDSMTADLDGDGRPELIYAWEGRRGDQGGVHRLKLTGEDVTDADAWDDRVLVQHPGAWWLGSSGRVDLADDGTADDIVYSARRHRNRAPQTGVFWLEAPGDPDGTWTRHTIADDVGAVLHVDTGDFNGDGDARDVLANTHRFESAHVFTYPNWEATELPLPDSGTYNVRRAPFAVGDRDAILVALAKRGLYLLAWDGQTYASTRLLPIDYRHPLDDRILYADLDGDGVAEAIIPDSGGNRMMWLKFMPE